MSVRKKRYISIAVAIFLILRILLMMSTFHGDLAFIWAIPKTGRQEDMTKFYKSYAHDYPEFFHETSTIYYPPGSLFFVTSFLPSLQNMSPTLGGWLGQMHELLLTEKAQSGSELFQHTANKDTFFNIFLLKLPYLFIDFLVFLLVIHLSSPSSRRSIGLLWLINPINLYTTYVMGQIDILMVFLVLLAIWIFKKSWLLASISLVGAVMVKTYPIIIMPVVILLGSKTLQRAIIMGGFCVVLFIFLNFPFALQGAGVLQAAYLPGIMANPISCALRPDALYNCGKLFIGTALIFLFGIAVFRWFCSKNPFSYLLPAITAILCIFYFIYRGLLLNHYLLLTPFLHWAWHNTRDRWKLFCFYILSFASFIYVKPLLGDVFAPTAISWLMNIDIRALVAPVIRYENIAFITKIFLDALLITTVIQITKEKVSL